ncbi:MAG: hypothetical protein KIH63_000840 [Candidatus Saccharibacteria bacterium]|nr:hypothetical protein [Candidatus Saccharibacteria bacterium]
MASKSRPSPGFGQKSIFDTGEIDPTPFEAQPDSRYAYPPGTIYEVSGRGKGRLSDHSGPIPRPQILAGMSDDDIRVQHAINTEGAAMVAEIMGNSQTVMPAVHPEYIDPESGHAILGAAKEYTDPHGLAINPAVAAAPEEPTWAQAFVAELKASMQHPHSTRRRW